MFQIYKTISLLIALVSNTYAWQNYMYNNLNSKVNYPTFPATRLSNVDAYSLNFESFAALQDPKQNANKIIENIDNIPKWLFLMRYNNKLQNELWHHELHNNIPCNIIYDNKILLHISTVGIFKTDVIFRVKYNIQKTNYGTIVFIDIDKNFYSDKVTDFKIILWTFPHVNNKNLTFGVMYGYIRTPFPILLFKNHIKWHIDSVLQNFGEQLKND